jgi:hypothetical protein
MCLLADENLFHVLIHQNLDVTDLETIEDSIAPIVISDSVYTSMIKKLAPLDIVVRTGWTTALWIRRQRLENLLALERRDPFKSLDEIKVLCSEILPIIHQFSPAVSETDGSLIAAAYWIRARTRIEPVLVTEDRGMLFACHLVSSYFGIALGVLSIFELMRLAGNEDYVAAYCEHYDTNPPRLTYPLAASRGKVSEEIGRLLSDAKLSTHPHIRAPDNYRRISPRSR